MGVGNGTGTVMGSQWDWEHLWFLFPWTDMMGSKLRGLIESAGPVSMQGGILPNQVPLVRETVGISPLFIHPQAYQSSPHNKLRAIGNLE